MQSLPPAAMVSAPPFMPARAPEESPSSLTFQWAEPVPQGRRLGFWVLVVMCGLAVFFYLFQVVYPQTHRFTPVPQQVVVLNPADPAAMALLSRVQDRDYLLLPTESGMAAGPRLQDHAPVFHPSFEGHQLRALDLPYKAFTVPPARLLNVDKPVLPPLDLSELKDRAPARAEDDPPAPAARLTVTFQGDLAHRPLLAEVDLQGIPLEYPESCRFQLGVNAAGHVEFILPLTTSEKPEVAATTTTQILARMRNARFEPVTKASTTPQASSSKSQPSPAPAVHKLPTWGVATLSWQEPTKP